MVHKIQSFPGTIASNDSLQRSIVPSLAKGSRAKTFSGFVFSSLGFLSLFAVNVFL